MRVLVACEFSGAVRDAFIALGHDAMSCDLLPTEAPGPHYQGNVLDILDDGWELMVAHPPCTFLANSANGSLWSTKPSRDDALKGPARWAAMVDGAVFFRQLLNAPIPRIAVENPIMSGHAKKIIGREQTQTVQPWMFGHPQKKATCLWLKGLAPLLPTDDVRGLMVGRPKSETDRVHYASPGPDRWKARSLTYPGIARAMAQQWGGDAREAVA